MDRRLDELMGGTANTKHIAMLDCLYDILPRAPSSTRATMKSRTRPRAAQVALPILWKGIRADAAEDEVKTKELPRHYAGLSQHGGGGQAEQTGFEEANGLNVDGYTMETCLGLGMVGRRCHW